MMINRSTKKVKNETKTNIEFSIHIHWDNGYAYACDGTQWIDPFLCMHHKTRKFDYIHLHFIQEFFFSQFSCLSLLFFYFFHLFLEGKVKKVFYYPIEIEAETLFIFDLVYSKPTLYIHTLPYIWDKMHVYTESHSK